MQNILQTCKKYFTPNLQNTKHSINFKKTHNYVFIFLVGKIHLPNNFLVINLLQHLIDYNISYY